MLVVGVLVRRPAPDASNDVRRVDEELQVALQACRCLSCRLQLREGHSLAPA